MESFTVATFRLGGQQQTGIGHYIDRLVAGLEARQDIAEVQVHELKRRELEWGRFRFGGYVSRYLDLLTKQIRADVVHASHIPFAHASSSSMMIQDAVWHQKPDEYADTTWFLRRLLPRIRRLPLVMAPSHASADAVQAALQLPCRPRVVPLAPDHDQFYPVDVDKPGYALYAGELRPRKRVPEMVAAAAEAGLDVVRCGPQKPRDVELSLQCAEIARRGGIEYHDVGYVTRDQLRSLYAGADVLLYGSQDEGWGLPPFEAAACGTQSVLSPIPVHKELWPDGLAHWATDGFAVALQDAVDHPIPAARLIEHARRYTWTGSVEGHVKAWKELLQRAPPRYEWCETTDCEGCKWCLPIPGSVV